MAIPLKDPPFIRGSASKTTVFTPVLEWDEIRCDEKAYAVRVS
jgi:hypothetical protein